MSTYLEELKNRQAERDAAKDQAFEQLTRNLLDEARGEKLSEARIAENDNAVELLALSVDHLAELARDLGELARLESEADRSKEVDRNVTAITTKMADFHARRQREFEAAADEERAINADLLAAEAQANAMRPKMARLDELRLKYWKASKVEDPEKTAKRRHLFSVLYKSAPATTATLIEFEQVMRIPTDAAHAVLLDEAYTFEAVPKQPAKELAALINTAREIVSWATTWQARADASDHRQPKAYYVVVESVDVPNVARLDCVKHINATAISETDIDDGPYYYLPFPGESRAKFEAAMTALRKAKAKARKAAGLEFQQIGADTELEEATA